jgi:glycosyltransferase involved in cell wall biosynthesis
MPSPALFALIASITAHVYGRSQREYLLDLGLAPDRIFTGRAVIDTARFHPRPQLLTSYKTLLFVGRFAPEKDLALLFTALSRLPQEGADPRLVLKLVGYGPLEPALRALAVQLGIDPFVQFHGPAPQADLPAIYSAADGIVLPSRSEPWGLVVNEAMCCGLLAAALDRFADLPRERLAAMGAAARALASQSSPERGAAAVLECLRAVQ